MKKNFSYHHIIILATVFSFAALISFSTFYGQDSLSANQTTEFYETARPVQSALLIFEEPNPSPLLQNLALESLLQNLRQNQKYSQIILINQPGGEFSQTIPADSFRAAVKKYFPEAAGKMIGFSENENESIIYQQLNSYFNSDTLIILPTVLLFNNSDPVLADLENEYFRIVFDNILKTSLADLNFVNQEAIKAFYQLNKDHLSLRTLPTLPDPEHRFRIKYFTTGQRSSNPAVSLTFFGDIMLGRQVRTRINQNGMDYPFKKLDQTYLHFNDLLIANLEGPIAEKAVKTTKTIAFRFLPDIAPLLKKYSFDLLSRANNHAFDMGVAGYQDTPRFLNEQGIIAFGNARDINDETVYKIEINGQKLVFLGLNDTDFKLDAKKGAQLFKQIDQLVLENYQPIIFIHWGTEYQHKPADFQVKFAHQAIDHGVVAFIGMHPHVVQSFEIYQNRPIFYSLGNFIFDQDFSSDTQEGLTVNLVIDPDQIKVSLFPVKIIDSQPELMSQEEKKAFLARLVNYWNYDDTTKDQILQGQIVLSNSELD